MYKKNYNHLSPGLQDGCLSRSQKDKQKMDEITKEINILVNKIDALEQALQQESAVTGYEKIFRKSILPRKGEVVLLEKSGNLWRLVERQVGRGWRKSP